MRRRDAGASEQEADAAGWGGLLDSLASLMSIDLPTDHGLAALPRPAADAGARRHAELGGALVRSLQGMMDVHASIEAASPCGLPKGCLPIDRIKAAELLPSHVLGAELGPLQLPLYEKVMPSQQAAAYAYLRAIADTGDAAAPPGSPGAVDADSLVALGDWSVCGPSNGGAPSPHSSAAEEQRPSLSSGQRPDAPGGGVSELRSSFKRLYMEMLTEGAADDLDNLRQAEALDEASLSLLVDALESGADTFDDETRALAIENYDGAQSWWARAQHGNGRGRKSEGGGDGAEEGEGEEEGAPGRHAAGCGAYGDAVSDSVVMARAAAVEEELAGMRGGKADSRGAKAAAGAQGGGGGGKAGSRGAKAAANGHGRGGGGKAQGQGAKSAASAHGIGGKAQGRGVMAAPSAPQGDGAASPAGPRTPVTGGRAELLSGSPKAAARGSKPRPSLLASPSSAAGRAREAGGALSAKAKQRKRKSGQ